MAVTKVVVFAAPLKFTTEIETKFVPLTVSVNAAPPAVALVGESDVIVGAGLLMMNVAVAEVPPPGAGLVTVTFTEPPVAISVARMAAVTCVELTNVVAFAEPLKFTTAPATKPVPFTVSVKAAPPAVALDGDSKVMAGSGLFTAKLTGPEAPPPGAGFVTTTWKMPTAAMSAAVMAAVTCVALTNVVVLALPLKLTEAPLTKPVPFTVKVNAAPPTLALAGESEVIAGTGLFTVRLTAEEVPPPGAGLKTVIGKEPAVAISAAVMDAVN